MNQNNTLSFQWSHDLFNSTVFDINCYRLKLENLIFGNEDVCPNYFNLNQPYIIADSFEAIITERI